MRAKVVFLFVVCLSIVGLTQNRLAVVRLGYYAPAVTDGGFIIGAQWVQEIDENLQMGFSVDWFNKTYTDQRLVNEYNAFDNTPASYGTTNELRAKTNLNLFPVQYGVYLNFPLQRDIKIYATGSLGLDFLIINYRSYTNPSNDETKVAVDFCWQVGVGVKYPLGRRSDVLAEISYHQSEPSWQYDVMDNAGKKKVFERSYDLSGFMIRAGVRFYY